MMLFELQQLSSSKLLTDLKEERDVRSHVIGDRHTDHHRRLFVEHLERREVCAASVTCSLVGGGVLRVEGTEGPDDIALEDFSTGVRVYDITRGIQVCDYPLDAVNSIVVRGLGGDDSLNALNVYGRKVTLYGDNGNDTLIGGSVGDILDGGEGDDSLDGGGGNDVLGGNSQFHQFLYQTGTPLREMGADFTYVMADWNGDRRDDMVAIKKSGTVSHNTELHVLSRATNFQTYLTHIPTALPQTGDNYEFQMADWNRDGRLDLIAIKKSATASKSTELHILDGANNFRTYLLHVATALHQTGDDYEFEIDDWNGDHKLDLVAIKKSNTSTHSTELHVLSGASNFQTYLLHTGTALPETNSTYEFKMGGWVGHDLVAFKKSNTGTFSTEVHVLNHSSNFQTYSLHTSTALPETGNNFELEIANVDDYPEYDVVAIGRFGTGSGTTEVHVLPGYSVPGEAGDDFMRGGEGDDAIFGGPGADTLYGDNGNDKLDGGLDNDGLFGGTGTNILRGSVGADRFLVWQSDTVKDAKSVDAVVRFTDGARQTVAIFGAKLTFGGARWTAIEIEAVDGALVNLHSSTGNTRLLKNSAGGRMTLQRLGAQVTTHPTGFRPAGWNSKDTSTITLTDEGIAGIVSDVVYHEFGHNWDTPSVYESKLIRKFRTLSGWREANSAPTPDYERNTDNDIKNRWWHLEDTDGAAGASPNGIVGEKFARRYGSTNPSEDFATTWEAYFLNRFLGTTLGNDLVPRKQAIIDQILDFLS